jgi:hypothetical protein
VTRGRAELLERSVAGARVVAQRYPQSATEITAAATPWLPQPVAQRGTRVADVTYGAVVAILS